MYLCIRLLLQEQRNKIFVDFVKVGGNIQDLVCRFEASLEENQQSKVQWGFRPEKWLQDRHGEKKATKLKARKEQLGFFFGCTHVLFPSLSKRTSGCCILVRPQNTRLIQDPELPDDPDEKLYFTMINLDMANITEVKRMTKLEMEGCIDQAGLDVFVKAPPIQKVQTNIKTETTIS